MLWIIEGEHDAPGWKTLLADAKAEKLDWRLLDRDAFVIVEADEPPTQYEGMVPAAPVDGLYIDQQGNHLYIVDRGQVAGPDELFEALGDEAKKLRDELGDHLVALQQLGKAY